MPADGESLGEFLPKSQQFATTHWSVVLAAGQDSSPAAREALERLCCAYWYPLYAYTRRRGFNSHDAEDLVQGFFGDFIARSALRGIERDGGRFRSFLLTCFNHFLNDERDRTRRQKRGGAQKTISLDGQDAEERYRLEPADLADPVRIYERRWALAVLDQCLARLRAELIIEGKGELFEHLQWLVVGEPGQVRQAEIAARLGTTPSAIAVNVHRLRQRYRRTLHQVVAQTVAQPGEVEDEMRHLLAILRG